MIRYFLNSVRWPHPYSHIRPCPMPSGDASSTQWKHPHKLHRSFTLPVWKNVPLLRAIFPGFRPFPAIYRETKKNYEDNFKKWNGELAADLYKRATTHAGTEIRSQLQHLTCRLDCGLINTHVTASRTLTPSRKPWLGRATELFVQNFIPRLRSRWSTLIISNYREYMLLKEGK